jgi:hypothetical protein
MSTGGILDGNAPRNVLGLLAATEIVNLWSSYTCSEVEGNCPVFGLLSRPIAAKTAGYRSTSIGIAVFHLTAPMTSLITAKGHHRVNFGCSACRQPCSQKRHRAHNEKGEAKSHWVQGTQAEELVLDVF